MLYHASGEIVEFLKLEKVSILRIFHGDFIAQIILNKQKSRLEEIGRVL